VIPPDRALILSIISGGIQAFQVAKSLGVEAEHLFDEDRLIFAAMEGIFLPKGKMPTIADIKLHLKIDIPPSDNVYDPELCAKYIVTRTLSTKLSDGIGPIIDLIPSDPHKARTDLSELIRSTNWSIGNVVRTNSPYAIDEIKKRYVEAKQRDGSLLGYSSPWKSRDQRSLGLQPGEVTVLLAKRKQGKSWLLLKWAEHIWTATLSNGEPELKPGENILVISMEMPVWQVMRRTFAIRNKLDYEKFRAGKLDPADEIRFYEWCEQMRTPDPSRSEIIFAGSDRVRTVGDIVGLTAQYRPKVVFIDSFYILSRSDKRMQLWERMLANISDIKLDLAVGLNVPVVATTQLSGQVKRGDLDAEADAVAYAKAIGDYADSIDGLFGNDQFRDQKKRILRGMEAREFVTVDLEINFDPGVHDYSEIRVVDSAEDSKKKGFGGQDQGDDDGDDGISFGADEILLE